jgi:hypothetical protein
MGPKHRCRNIQSAMQEFVTASFVLAAAINATTTSSAAVDQDIDLDDLFLPLGDDQI